uniref:L-tyrosine decarboxylase C-terminal domain-containing protein n=1 Tax=Schizophyllum commune (strain H4-8 / FGSC 9210) TaxID=578458 RepID=D8Q5H7_SCHCM
MHESISAWFLGPRAENYDLLKQLFAGAVDSHARVRENYYAEDGVFITDSIKESKTYQANVTQLREQTCQIVDLLNKYSVPFFSPRYAGHMSFETSLPGIVGWVATILNNPNNVAFEASPFTTLVELEVGSELCSMLGYPMDTESTIQPWGHIACDGTIANMESMWVARNLKFYPLSVHAAMTDPEGPLRFVADSFKVPTADSPHEPQLFKDLDSWQLLNLPISVTLGIGEELLLQYGITNDFLTSALSPYLVQSTGMEELIRKYNITAPPQYLISNTKHYSWPKSAALVGIGSSNTIPIPVDSDARINFEKLDALLQERLDNKQAVYGVVAVIGSTEEGAVDPLDKVIELRNKYAELGMTFVVHADAAWGGYFASMIRDPPSGGISRDDDEEDEDGSRDFVPSITMREYSVRQFDALKDADSITIDPHKAGYVPYPAGGLCYKDGRMRYLVTWTAPYLHDSNTGESIGVYGIEGSKPGAAAVATFMHNNIVGLHKHGQGALLGEVAFTCRRFSAHWAAMSDDKTDFIVVPFNKFVHEADGDAAILEEKAFIRENILGQSNQAIVQNKDALDEICGLGSDLNINAFACNFRINGEVNTDVAEANYLNSRIFDILSLTGVGELPETIPMFLSATTFAHADYGECADAYKRRLGLETDSEQDLFVLRNVCMSPFQAAGDFVQELAKIFQETLENEVQVVVKRNTVSPQIHEFTMQGNEQLYLTYRPLFNHANGRQQVILRVGEMPADAWEKYKAAVAKFPGSTYTLRTSELDLQAVDLSKVEIVKQRALNSAYYDKAYPKTTTPFYVYGSPTEVHADHMLLRAPNAQISSAHVKLGLESVLSAEQLARGVIAHVEVPEQALQPLAEQHPFSPGAKFRVTITEDAFDATAHGPNLAEGGAQLATGTLTLGRALNTQDFEVDKRAADYTSTGASGETKAEWARVISEELGLKPAGGKVVQPPKGSNVGSGSGLGLGARVFQAGGEVAGGAVNAGGSVAGGAVKGGLEVTEGMRKAGQTLFSGFRL